MLSVKYIKESLLYDSNEGVLYWRKDRPKHHFANDGSFKRYQNMFAGKIAGHDLKCKGYIYKAIKINSHRILYHRALWVVYYGKYPEGVIDHINGNTRDNRIENIRDCSQSENCRNRAMMSNNTSGHTGVHWCNRSGKWVAQGDGKVATHLGYFEDIQDAIEARRDYELKTGYTNRHGQRNWDRLYVR